MDRREFISGTLAMALGGSIAGQVNSTAGAGNKTGFDPDDYDPGAFDPPQFSLFWNFSKPRTEWEAISYLRLFFRPAFQGLHGYFEGRDRAWNGTPPDRPVEILADALFPETYGVPLFRAQSERAARAISGLSASEARTLKPRKSEEPIGPRLSKNRLVVGAIRQGVPEPLARQIPFLLYVDAEPDLPGRCIRCLDQMRKGPASEGHPPYPDWRIDPPYAARRFNSWLELVIRRYLRGHWKPPTGSGRLPQVPSPDTCRSSFPDLSSSQVEAAIENARTFYKKHPNYRDPSEIEVIPLP